MERETYLEKEKYNDLHNYLSSILERIEFNVTNYLKTHELQKLLVKKVLVFAKMQPILSYKISYDFFEEAEEIGFKEKQVSFTIVLSFHPGSYEFDINADITSVFEMASLGWYKKIEELPLGAKTYFENAPVKFIEILENFFSKEFFNYPSP